jgi:hypothetical protein
LFLPVTQFNHFSNFFKVDSQTPFHSPPSSVGVATQPGGLATLTPIVLEHPVTNKIRPRASSEEETEEVILVSSSSTSHSSTSCIGDPNLRTSHEFTHKRRRIHSMSSEMQDVAVIQNSEVDLLGSVLNLHESVAVHDGTNAIRVKHMDLVRLIIDELRALNYTYVTYKALV